MVREKKLLVLSRLFGAEVDRLVKLLGRLQADAGGSFEFSESQIHEALVELAACFPVYRTYVRPESGAIEPVDAVRLEEAVGELAFSGRSWRSYPA